MSDIELLQAILQLLQLVAGQQGSAAKEHVPYAIEQDALLTRALVDSPIFGLAELYAYIQDAINAIQKVRLDTASPHLGTITDVLDAIAALTPVTLPTEPPPGYGGGDTSSLWATVVDVAQMCSLD